MKDVDLLVVGGGINGVGIARDAAGRGLEVALCEMNDLASATSSWSTKLIHGGLRYLEHYEFRLVRESLIEREVLLDAAPHLISPLRFILPHHRGLRPYWMLRLGLFLYDHLGGRRFLAATKSVNLRSGPLGAPLRDDFRKGLEYTDCRADDSRLVVANALDAAERGARIMTRTRFVSGKREGNRWSCELEGAQGEKFALSAKIIVNAAGPWVTDLFEGIDEVSPKKRLRLVKGSHIITKKLYDHDRAYIFQNADGRIMFTIPYRDNTTLVGTTDEAYEGDPAQVSISENEKEYLRRGASEYFKQDIRDDMIVSDFSGVRPLYDEISGKSASAVTRDYAFDIDRGADGRSPALLSIYGGKLTTYRKLAEHALSYLADDFETVSGAWTRSARLPGGDMGYANWQDYLDKARDRYDFVPADTLNRMLRAYGSRIELILADCAQLKDLGTHFGAGLYQRELDYLREKEWAQSAEDVLWRRGKLGLSMSAQEQQRVVLYFQNKKAA